MEGYNLADTVEYLDLSRSWVQDGRIEPSLRRMRSPAFPLLLSPFFHLWSFLGLEDLRSLALVVRFFQVIASTGLVLVAVRLGTSLYGRSAGLVSGFLIAVNPIFLRYCADPLPDITAGVCLGLACERLLARRGSLVGGLLCGVSFSLSYKVLPLVIALALGLFVRDRWRYRAGWAGVLSGLALASGVQVVLDRWAYGVWGLSLGNYLVYNVGIVSVSILGKLGLDSQAAHLLEFANHYYGSAPRVPLETLASRIEQSTSTLWFVTHLHEFLVAPVLLLGILAVWYVWRHKQSSGFLLLFAVTVYFVVLGNKDSRTYRHCLPALPLIGSLCCAGWVVLEDVSRGRANRFVTFGRGVLLAGAAALGFLGFVRAGPRLHGHYWQAIEWLEQAVVDAEPPQRFGAAGFPVLFRYSPKLELVPLQAPRLASTENAGPELERQFVREVLESLDWLIISRSLLNGVPGLQAEVAAQFQLEASFFDDGHSEALGPVHVFRR